MQKHHVYLIVGGILSLLLPVYAPLHRAGLGVLTAGVIDWLHSSFTQNS